MNSDWLQNIIENYMVPRQWTYLREMVQASPASNQTQVEFQLSAGVTSPKQVFVFLQRQNRINSQLENPHALDLGQTPLFIFTICSIYSLGSDADYLTLRGENALPAIEV